MFIQLHLFLCESQALHKLPEIGKGSAISQNAHESILPKETPLYKKRYGEENFETEWMQLRRKLIAHERIEAKTSANECRAGNTGR
jgi:hypothetical protein